MSNLSGKSWVLGTVDAKGAFGVMQVFDIAQHGNSTDANFWDNASARALEAARKAQAGWQHHFTRTKPDVTLTVRMMTGDRCTAVVNK